MDKFYIMVHIFLDAFSVAQYITNPISLAAFAIAAIMTYFISRNANDRKKIESAKEEERSDLIIRTAERLHLDISQVPKNERAALIKQVLRNRIISQIISAVVIVILGLFITYLVSEQIGKPNRNTDSLNSSDSLKSHIPTTTIIQKVDSSTGPIIQSVGDSNTNIGEINKTK
jgi:undecaprenyl pyrophosphate phosphatase UppP